MNVPTAGTRARRVGDFAQCWWKISRCGAASRMPGKRFERCWRPRPRVISGGDFARLIAATLCAKALPAARQLRSVARHALIAAPLFAALLAGCVSTGTVRELQGDGLGSTWKVKIADPHR